MNKSFELPLPMITFVSQPDVLDCWFAQGWIKEDTEGYQDHTHGFYIPKEMFLEILREMLSPEQVKQLQSKYFRKISDIIGEDK